MSALPVAAWSGHFVPVHEVVTACITSHIADACAAGEHPLAATSALPVTAWSGHFVSVHEVVTACITSHIADACAAGEHPLAAMSALPVATCPLEVDERIALADEQLDGLQVAPQAAPVQRRVAAHVPPVHGGSSLDQQQQAVQRSAVCGAVQGGHPTKEKRKLSLCKVKTIQIHPPPVIGYTRRSAGGSPYQRKTDTVTL